MSSLHEVKDNLDLHIHLHEKAENDSLREMQLYLLSKVPCKSPVLILTQLPAKENLNN